MLLNDYYIIEEIKKFKNKLKIKNRDIEKAVRIEVYMAINT